MTSEEFSVFCTQSVLLTETVWTSLLLSMTTHHLNACERCDARHVISHGTNLPLLRRFTHSLYILSQVIYMQWPSEGAGISVKVSHRKVRTTVMKSLSKSCLTQWFFVFLSHMQIYRCTHTVLVGLYVWNFASRQRRAQNTHTGVTCWFCFADISLSCAFLLQLLPKA